MKDNTIPQVSRADQGWMKFVEVKTKTTTSMVFILCLSFSWHMGWKISWLETLIYIAATLIVDLGTTSVNNYMGYKKEGEKLTVKPKTGRIIIFSLFTVAVLLGILLVSLTQNVLILFVGAISFLVGALYTTGPLPIAATPLGEILSGGVQGYLNMLVYALINVPAGRFMLTGLEGDFISLHLEWPWLVAFALFGWIPTLLIANVMLANNTCDLTKDEAIGRYTLPHYIGRQKSLTLYQWLYYSAYIAVAALVVLRVFSWWQLLMLPTIVPVHQNIMTFKEKQEKAETFILSLKNLALIMLSLTLTLCLSALFA